MKNRIGVSKHGIAPLPAARSLVAHPPTMSFLLSGGLPGAFLQSLAVYYGSALLLDVGIPKFTKTRSVQLSRRPQVSSPGPELFGPSEARTVPLTAVQPQLNVFICDKRSAFRHESAAASSHQVSSHTAGREAPRRPARSPIQFRQGHHSVRGTTSPRAWIQQGDDSASRRPVA